MQRSFFYSFQSCSYLVLMLAFSGHAQVSSELKSFLDSRGFPELLTSYSQEQISLNSIGRQAKSVAAQPFTVQTGFRCQAFAGTGLGNAERVAEELRALQLDSVYVITTAENLYKVQIGNFIRREDAEALKEKLKTLGLVGVWVVDDNIHVNKPSAASIEPQGSIANPPEPSLYFAIQIFATNDALKANELKTLIEQETGYPVDVVQQSSIWKVLVGKFNDREQAEAFLKTIKRDRYKDAWITQVVSS